MAVCGALELFVKVATSTLLPPRVCTLGVPLTDKHAVPWLVQLPDVPPTVIEGGIARAAAEPPTSVSSTSYATPAVTAWLPDGVWMVPGTVKVAEPAPFELLRIAPTGVPAIELVVLKVGAKMMLYPLLALSPCAFNM